MNGIITNGLLGNLIINQFSLSLGFIEVIVEAPGKSRVTATEQYLPPQKTKVIINIKLNKKMYTSTYYFTDTAINIIVKSLKIIDDIKKSTINVFVKNKEPTDNPMNMVKVRILDKNDEKN